MRIKIFQMHPVIAGRDAITGMKIEPSKLDSSVYNLVYDGAIACDDKSKLGAIFAERSTDIRATYFHGHNLRTNDIVEIIENDNSSFFQFEEVENTDGLFHPIEPPKFASTAGTYDARNRAFGVFAEPGKMAQIRSIDLHSDGLKRLFGTDYDIIKLSPNRDICVICSKSFFGSTPSADCPPLNRMLLSLDKYDVQLGPVSGPIFFCGARFMSRNDTVVLHSLNAKMCDFLLNNYRLPERFFEFNGELRSVQYYPNTCVIQDNEGAFK